MRKLVAAMSLVALLVGGAAHGAGKAAPANTSKPTISGTAKAGETLTASSGSWSNSPTSFSYRWQRCNSSGSSCSNISGAANQTYLVQKGDVDRRLRVSVTASNSDGSANAVSDPTAVVAKGDPPQNTAEPAISGTAKAGLVLSTTNGSWNNNPTSFRYQWLRCNTAGNNCGNIGSNRATYTLRNEDVGATIRVRVRATNPFGSTDATANATAIVAPAGSVPANTTAPTISGLPRNGQTLVANTGNWTNGPTKYAFEWLRCDNVGNNCRNFGGHGQSQRLGSSEVGHAIRVTVTATNSFGASKATSAPTAAVSGAAAPSTAIPVSQVSLPQRLVISGVQFIPNPLKSRSAFLARFRVSDTRGNLVSGALVYALGLPYGWVRNAPEVTTSGNGWATIQIFPTRLMPLRRAALVMFVRARKPGDNLLAGVSARRLVQVRIGG
jgi:hypothetical protein